MTDSPLLATIPPLGDLLGAQLGPSIAAGFVVMGAVVAAIMVGRRVRSEARQELAGGPAVVDGPSELTSRHVFRVLQERKIATVEEIAAMSPRERQLLFDSVARKVTPLAGVPAVTASGSGTTPAPAAASPTAPVGVLHCPACAAPIAEAAASNRVVVPCPGCGRRISARRDGVRVSVTVDDSPTKR